MKQARGCIVDCPQCHINVIVPPKSSSLRSTRSHRGHRSRPATNARNMPNCTLICARNWSPLGSKLKELQTQRAEINNRMAARINEINRDICDDGPLWKPRTNRSWRN